MRRERRGEKKVEEGGCEELSNLVRRRYIYRKYGENFRGGISTERRGGEKHEKSEEGARTIYIETTRTLAN